MQPIYPQAQRFVGRFAKLGTKGKYALYNDTKGLDDDEYLTILVKFDKGTFNTQNVIPNNFEYYHRVYQ